MTRLQIRAWVTHDGQVLDTHTMGTMTIGDLLIYRPDKGRYVIGQEVSSGSWWVLDVYQIYVRANEVPQDFPSSARQIYRDYETAVAATVMLDGGGK